MTREFLVVRRLGYIHVVPFHFRHYSIVRTTLTSHDAFGDTEFVRHLLHITLIYTSNFKYSSRHILPFAFRLGESNTVE